MAWLHDVVEDSPVSASVLTALGWSPAVVGGVALMTRIRERADQYYSDIGTVPVARAVKVADIAHNTSPSRRASLDPATAERLGRKYDKALTALDAHGLVPTIA